MHQSEWLELEILTIKQTKRQAISGEKKLRMTHSTHLYPEHRKHSLNSTIRKQSNKKRMGKRLEQLTEEDMGVATKHVKRYPMLLDINKV